MPKAEEKEAYKPKLFKEEEDEIEVHTDEAPNFVSSDELKEAGVYKDTIDKILSIKIMEQALRKDFDFRYNIMNGQFEYKRKKNQKYTVLEEHGYNSLYRHLLYHHYVNCTSAKIKKSVESEFSPKKHPLRGLFIEWGNLVKDDNTDYINQVANLVKTDAPKGLWNTVFKKWAVASVANVFVDPYCTNRYCPILIGMQDSGKSKFWKSLWPSKYPEYFYSGEIDLKNNKDSVLRLVDTFLIMIDEQISVISEQKEWEQLKALISQDRVKKRRVFARSDTMGARIANFCGSANPTEILQDPTGNTRFLTFKIIDHINLNAFQELDMFKFWGQAYQLHKAAQNGDFFYLLETREKKLMKKYQEKFRKYDIEHELILDAFQIGTENDFDYFYTSTEIWKMFREEYKSLNLTTNKIGSALKFLGFTRRRRKRGDDGRVEGWFLKNNDTKEEERLKTA